MTWKNSYRSFCQWGEVHHANNTSLHHSFQGNLVSREESILRRHRCSETYIFEVILYPVLSRDEREGGLFVNSNRSIEGAMKRHGHHGSLVLLFDKIERHSFEDFVEVFLHHFSINASIAIGFVQERTELFQVFEGKFISLENRLYISQ